MLANCSGVQGRNLNRRAKGWAQTQLRRATTPVVKNSNLHHIGEFWGYTAQESMEMMLDKVNTINTIYVTFNLDKCGQILSMLAYSFFCPFIC